MKKERLCIIDADSLLYYTMGANSLEEAISDIDSRIIDILEKCKSKNYILCVTEDNCFRYDLATIRPYKGNRKKGNKPIIFYALKQHLKQKYLAYSDKRLEADDAVAFFKKKLEDTYDIIICSPDKDVRETVEGKHYDYSKNKFTTTSLMEACKFLFTQTLTGDSTDNIQGVPGVGTVKANKLLSKAQGSIFGATLDVYIEEFGLAQGVYRFQENFRLVYLLRTDEDMLREIGLVPSIPKVQTINLKTSNGDDKEYSQF